MNKHTQPTHKDNTNHGVTSDPRWWSDTHASAWDRAKEALRRDWEQTKADFSSGGADLNQGLTDTMKQATGVDAIPSPTALTHPDAPQAAARRFEKAINARSEAQEKISVAQTKMVVEQVRADAKIAQGRHDAAEKIAHAQAKADEIAADSRAEISNAEKNGQEKLAQQQKKIADLRVAVSDKAAATRADAREAVATQQSRVAEARKTWGEVEPAVRYGYGARMEYASNQAWDEHVDARLRGEWQVGADDAAWDATRPYVRHGWDAARDGRRS